MNTLDLGYNPLNTEDQEIFTRLADYLVPSAEGMPSASQAGVPDVWLRSVLSIRADLIPDLLRALHTAYQAQSMDDLKTALADDRPAFVALTTIVSGAYYLNPEVQKLIGYPGQQPREIDTQETPDYTASGMLDRVSGRGRLYRTLPD